MKAARERPVSTYADLVIERRDELNQNPKRWSKRHSAWRTVCWSDGTWVASGASSVQRMMDNLNATNMLTSFRSGPCGVDLVHNATQAAPHRHQKSHPLQRSSITDISRHDRNATGAPGSLALSRHPAQPAGSMSVLLRTMTVRTSSAPPRPRASL